MTENFIVRAVAILIVGVAAAAFYWGGGRLQGYPVLFAGVLGIAITTAFFLGLLGTMSLWNMGRIRQAQLLGFILLISMLSKAMYATRLQWTDIAISVAGVYSLTVAWWYMRKR